MAINDQRINELAARLAKAMGVDERPAPKGNLRLVTTAAAPAARTMDSVSRESHVRLIRSLRRFYRPFGIDVVIDQALLGKGKLDDLDDQELVELLSTIHRARECINDGISFEDAGLLPEKYG